MSDIEQATGTVIRLPLPLLRRDGGTQIRAQISLDVAKEYAEAMGRGDAFPPVQARYDGSDHWLTDGYHRIMAAELAGLADIEVSVRPGTRRDAILDAVGANASHGYRRTNADKRQAVLTVLADPEWAKKSDREIARLAHVDVGMVGRLRPPPSVDERQTRTVTRGGSTFEMNVVAINRGRAVAPLAPAASAPAAPVARGSRQLRTFLGEIRQGSDVQTAAVVSEMSIGEARLHHEAELAGEYADVVEIPPPWSLDGDTLSLRVVAVDDDEQDPEEGASPPANDDEQEDPAPFDFEAAQQRDGIMRAIEALAAAPDLASFNAAWAKHLGRGVPGDLVSRAAQWLTSFALVFPEIERNRQLAIANMLEKI